MPEIDIRSPKAKLNVHLMDIRKFLKKALRVIVVTLVALGIVVWIGMNADVYWFATLHPNDVRFEIQLQEYITAQNASAGAALRSQAHSLPVK